MGSALFAFLENSEVLALLPHAAALHDHLLELDLGCEGVLVDHLGDSSLDRGIVEATSV